MDKKKRGQKISVVIDTQITQEQQSEKHHFAETGQLINIKGNWYIRFVEHSETGEVPVTFRVDDSHEVRLTRKAESQLNLLFKQDEKTDNYYVTPYGTMNITVFASKVDAMIDVKNTSGQIEVSYQIITDGETVGNYQIKLHFNA